MAITKDKINRINELAKKRNQVLQTKKPLSRKSFTESISRHSKPILKLSWTQ